MKRVAIEALHINGFGHFAGYDLRDFGPGVTVLYGPNEAGKSTLLAFIRAALFGLKPETNKEAHAPLRGGAYGGSITLRDGDGLAWQIARSKGPRGGKLMVSDRAGLPVSDPAATLEGVLGHVTADLFAAVFAFGLSDLEELGHLVSGELSDHIYSAGLGAKELPALLDSLTKRADGIFTKRGTRTAMAATLTDLAATRSRLVAVESQSREYAGRRARQEALATEVREAAGRLDAARHARTQAAQLLRGLDDARRLDALDRELIQLPEFDDIPDDAVARWQSAAASLETAEHDMAAAQQVAAAVEARALAPIEDEALLEQRDFVDQLARDRGNYDKSLADLPKRMAEAAHHEEEARNALSGLGPEWDEERAGGFSLTPELNDSIRQFMERLEAGLAERQRAVQRQEDAERQLGESSDLLRRAQTARDAAPAALSATEVDERERALGNSRRALRAYEAAEQSATQRRAAAEAFGASPPSARPSNAWLAPAVVAALSVVLGAAVGGSYLPAGLTLGAIAAVVGAWMFSTRKRGRGADPRIEALLADLASAEDGAALALDALAQASAIFGDAVPTEDVLFEIELLLRRERESLGRAAQLHQACAEADDRYQRALANVDATNAAVVAADAAHASTLAEWRDWLAGLGFAREFSPATIATLFAAIANAQRHIAAHRESRHRVTRIEEDLAAYSERLSLFCGRLGVEQPSSPQSVGPIADDLIRRAEGARIGAAHREADRRRLQEEIGKLDLSAARVAACHDAVQALLAAAGASNETEFFARAALAQRRATLAEQSHLLHTALGQLAPEGASVDEFLHRLRSADRAELEGALTVAEMEIAELEQHRAELQQEAGANDAALLALSGDEEASEARAHESVALEQLRAEAHEWSVAALAKAMLIAARTKYEDERQPGVIRDAQTFFTAMTGGRYTGIIVPMGSRTPIVVAADGSRRTPEQLSRGTREQLYLAMRLGLVREFAVRECALPIILDEVLVNFDPERQRRAARAFAEVSDDHQLLVFTCQPAMVDLFREVAPNARVIDIEAAARSASPLSLPLSAG